MPNVSRRLTAAACAVALLVPAAPAAAVDAPPTELWEDYPLREERGAPGGGAPAPAPRSEPAARDGGPPVAALAGGGAALLALLGAGAVLASRRRSARPAPARAAAPASAPAPARAEGEPGAAPRPTVVFGYLRASPEAALLDEAARVREAAARRGFTLRHVVWDRPDEPTRPWLSWVVGRIAAGEASGVVLAQLDDLGASPAERETVLDRLEALGATVVAVDDGIDPSTDRLTRRPAATGASREIAT